MPRNIEIKLRYDDLDAVRARAIATGADDRGTIPQVDTFFACATGRLKLREIADARAELIWYARADVAGAKASDYVVSSVADAITTRAALAAALGVVKVVRKRRDLLIWRNVRIHLDRVDGLGDFVELESVVGEVDESAAIANLYDLLGTLGLRDAERVAVAYADLLPNSEA